MHKTFRQSPHLPVLIISTDEVILKLRTAFDEIAWMDTASAARNEDVVHLGFSGISYSVDEQRSTTATSGE